MQYKENTKYKKSEKKLNFFLQDFILYAIIM